MPNNAHFITLEKAIDMTTLYRDEKENILTEEYQNQNVLPLSETFNRAAFDSLLAEEDCESLRIYYGMDAEYKIHAIVVGVDSENNDILPPENQGPEGGEIIEEGQRCPDVCPPTSPLNG